MYAPLLQRLYSVTQRVIHRNVEGIGEEEGWWSPEPGGNCLNWIVGHIVATRGGILGALGGKPVWSPEEENAYVRGAPSMREAGAAHSLASILAALDESQSRIASRIAATSEADFAAAPLPDFNAFKAASLGELLVLFHFHESYHAGQTGILRRLLGREGAIR